MRKIIPIDTNYEFMDKRKIMMLLEDALNNSISNHESNFNIMMLDIDF